MDWTTWIVLALVLAAFLLWKKLSLISAGAAREWLRKGAVIIDVRSPSEYQSRHVPGAINLPLDELHDRIAAKVPDKTTPLLLHCLSGGRSALAKRILKQAGYPNTFNLGSLGRAEKLTARSENPAGGASN